MNYDKFRISANEEFWANKLQGIVDVADPYQGITHTVANPGPSLLFSTLPAEFGAKLKQLCGHDDINISCFLLAGLSVAIAEKTESDNLLFATGAIESKGSGNVLFLHSSFDRITSFKELLLHFRAELLDSMKHEEFSYQNIVSKLRAKEHHLPHIFPFSFTYENIQPSVPEGCIINVKVRLEDDDAIKLSVESKASNFDAENTLQLLNDYKAMLVSVISDPKKTLLELRLAKTGTSTNAGVCDFSPVLKRSLISVFAEKVFAFPKRPALLHAGRQMSYQELDEASDRLAGVLRRMYDIKKDSIVALYISNIELLATAMLATLKVRGAYFYLDVDAPAERKRILLERSQPKVILTESSLFIEVAGFDREVFPMDLQTEEIAVNAIDSEPEADDLAYIIFTSGSTGEPKGVMVNHGSLLSLIDDQILRMHVTERDRVLNMLPFTFDVAHYHLFTSLLSGGGMVDTGKALINYPISFYAFLREHQVTIAGIPPAYLRNLEVEQLSFLRILYTGGEAAKFSDIELLLKAGVQVFNQYGLTESTCVSLVYKCEPDSFGFLPIGFPIGNTRVYLLDEELLPVAWGRIGEIYIGGTGVARGYLDQPELTNERFFDNPFRKGDRLLRTGDLGRRLSDGNIEFLGRVDRQIKIRGYRIEPQEIENAFYKHHAVRQVIVKSLSDEQGDDYLVAYVVGNQPIDVRELQGVVSKVLPKHMHPSFILPMDAFPVTPHGKLDFSSFPVPEKADLVSARSFAPARNAVEDELLEIWKNVLKRDNIGIYDNFFEIGGHSLKATQVALQMYKHFKVNLELGVLFSNYTIAALAAVIEKSEKSEFFDIKPLPAQDHYAVSHAQRRLWLLAQLHQTTAYNIPGAYVLKNLDADAFKRSIYAIVDRQESLRTVFLTVDGEPRQKILSAQDLGFAIAEIDLSALEDKIAMAKKLAITESGQNFDLERGPLVRAHLLKMGQNEYVFLLWMHHIISDGWSMQVLINELVVLYEAFQKGEENPLTPLGIAYKDFASWQNENILASADEKFWRNTFSDNASLVKLSYDRPRTELTSFSGAMETIFVEDGIRQKLAEMAAKHNTTLSVVILTIFKILLNRLSGQGDICIAMTVANRTHASIQNIIGYFANLVLIKSHVNPDDTFESLIAQVNQTVIAALNHQNYPFDLLVEKLNPVRYNDFQPLINVAYTFQSQHDIVINLEKNSQKDGHSMRAWELEVSNFIFQEQGATAKFELLLFVEEVHDGLWLKLEYNKDLFDKDTIVNYLKYMTLIADSVVADVIQL